LEAYLRLAVSDAALHRDSDSRAGNASDAGPTAGDAREDAAARGEAAGGPADLDRALRLLDGVRGGLSGGGEGGLLRPWTAGKPAPGDDPHDYLTGPAVFWRYALHAARRGPPPLQAALAAAPFRRFVLANAAAAAAAAPPAAGAGACARMVNLTNDLAALVAAMPSRDRAARRVGRDWASGGAVVA
jgi:hypothetical protein